MGNSYLLRHYYITKCYYYKSNASVQEKRHVDMRFNKFYGETSAIKQE